MVSYLSFIQMIQLVEEKECRLLNMTSGLATVMEYYCNGTYWQVIVCGIE